MSFRIGQRIKDRRKELNMTQYDLAQKMGYKSKAAICKVETSEDNITTDRVKKFADALDTSVSFLMGWTDDPGISIIQSAIDKENENYNKLAEFCLEHAFDSFSDEALDVAMQFDMLLPEQQEHIMNTMKLFLGGNK